MFKFNPSRNTLEIKKNDLPDIEVKSIDHKASLADFCKYDVPKIIREEFLPLVNKCMPAGVRYELVGVACNPRPVGEVKIPYVTQSPPEPLRDSEFVKAISVKAKFKLVATSESEIPQVEGFDIYEDLNNSYTEYVEIMQLPFIKDDNTICVDGKVGEKFKYREYSFIQELQLASSVSMMNDGTLAIKCDSGQTMTISSTSSKKLKVKFKKKEKAVPLGIVTGEFAAALGYTENELADIYSQITFYDNVRSFCRETELKHGLGAKRMSITPDEVLTLLESKFTGERAPFKATGVREDLNRLLSLRRAVGLRLSRPIVGKDRIIATKGEIVTDAIVDECMRNGVHVFYVENETPFNGYAADMILIRKVPAGVKNNAHISHIVTPSDKDAYYTTQTIDSPFMVDKDTFIDTQLWTLLKECGVESMSVKSSKTSKTSFVYYFETEVMDNRQVLGKFIGQADKEWMYHDPVTNQYVDNDENFTLYDFVALHSVYPQLRAGMYPNWALDADACFRKKLTTIRETFGKAMRMAITSFYYDNHHILRQELRENNELLLNHDNKSVLWKLSDSFVRALQDKTKSLAPINRDAMLNPIAYASTYAKANIYAANAHGISSDQRKVAIGSIGIIDAYEVPQSAKMGVVNYTTMSHRQTERGCEVAYYPVDTSSGLARVCLDKLTWLTPRDEESKVIADICGFTLSSDGHIIDADLDDLILCRAPAVGKASTTFELKPLRDIEYVNADPDMTLGFASASIPFLCCNDAIRATFGISQIKEAKGCVKLEPPIVETPGLRKLALQDSPFGFVAPCDGYIQAILPKARTGGKAETMTIAYTGPDADKYNDPNFPCTSISYWKDNISDESITRKYSTLRPGDSFKKGDVLVASNFLSEDGHIQYGVNALVAYIADGYNYEDGAHISTEFANRLSSYQLRSENVYKGFNSVSISNELTDRKYYHPGDRVSYTINRRFSSDVKRHVVKEEGYFYDAPISNDGQYHSLDIRYLATVPAIEGDKIADRHGNKGVITRISPAWEMPTLANGMPVELTRNPLGVGTRMNLGQIKEARMGLAGHLLGIHIEASTFNYTEEDLDYIFEFVWTVANQGAGVACSMFPDIPEEVADAAIAREEYIQSWAGVFDKNGEGYLYYNGVQNPVKVVFGYVYICKLIQEVESKIAFRGGYASGEEYSKISDSPVKGRKAGGGQRMGSMEMAALCAYGCENYIDELYLYRCDNGVQRAKFAAQQYMPDVKVSSYSEGQRRSITQFLSLMACLGTDVSCTNNEFYDIAQLSMNPELLAYDSLSAVREKTTRLPKRPPKVVSGTVEKTEGFEYVPKKDTKKYYTASDGSKIELNGKPEDVPDFVLSIADKKQRDTIMQSVYHVDPALFD